MIALDLPTVLALGGAIAALLTLACMMLSPSLGGGTAARWQSAGNLAFTAMMCVRIAVGIHPSPVGYALIWSLLLVTGACFGEVLESAARTPARQLLIDRCGLGVALALMWGAVAVFETAHAAAIVSGTAGAVMYLRGAWVAHGLRGTHPALPSVVLSASLAVSGLFSAKHSVDRYLEWREGLTLVQAAASTWFAAVLLFVAINIGMMLLLYLGLAERVRQLVRTDELTGALNRRALTERMARAPERVPGAVLLIDIDHFKVVNDAHGHAVGDEVLRWFAHTLRRFLRSDDLLVRMGGEEFCVLLPGVDGDLARAIAERIRAEFASRDTAPTSAGPLRITASFGYSLFGPGDTLDAQLRQADDALYAAKRAGRNRVVRWVPELAQPLPV